MITVRKMLSAVGGAISTYDDKYDGLLCGNHEGHADNVGVTQQGGSIIITVYDEATGEEVQDLFEVTVKRLGE